MTASKTSAATSDNLPEELIVQTERLPAGNHWSLVLKRGYTLRLIDIDGGANVSALFYNREEKTERYNMPDTLKAQHIAFLTKGYVCYSDMGRILISISADTCGWHDTFCGVTDAADIRARYGNHDYQQHRNDYYRNGRDSFLIQLGRYGLGKRDLVPNVNFFSRVNTEADGTLRFDPDNSPAGSYVDLRAEMDVLLILNSCPHPLDPGTRYPTGEVELTVWRSGPGGGPDDICRLSRPENERGFRNTAAYYAQV